MSHSYALDKHVMDLIPKNVDGILILDVAQGLGNWGYQIQTKKKGSPILIGLDIWPPYTKKVNRINIYNELIICDARAPPIRFKAAHIVLACEVLEHLPYKEALTFLKEMENLHQDTLIITTPRGFMKQDTIEGNPHEKHVSGWHEKELQKRGYETKIVPLQALPKTLKPIANLRRIILKLLFDISPVKDLIIAWKTM